MRTVFGGLSDDLEGMPAPVDDEDVAEALEMERAIGQLKAQFQQVVGIVGKELVPLFTELTNLANNVTESLPGGSEGAADLTSTFREWGTGLGVIEKGAAAVNRLFGENNDKVATSVDLWGGFNKILDDAADAVLDAADGQGHYADAVADTRTELEGQVSAIYAAIAAEEEQANARRAQADAGIAARDAQRQFVEQLTKSNEALAAEGVTMYDAAEAMDAAASSAAKVADSQVRLAEETATAEGKTVSASSKQSLWNQSMLTSARTAEGPLRDSIVNYIATVNGIPAEKVSEILANPDYATIDAASAAIDQAAADRDAAVRAEATNVGPTENTLNNVARDRNAKIILGMSYPAGYNPVTGTVNSAGVSAAATAGPMVAATAAPAARPRPPHPDHHHQHRRRREPVRHRTHRRPSLTPRTNAATGTRR